MAASTDPVISKIWEVRESDISLPTLTCPSDEGGGSTGRHLCCLEESGGGVVRVH